MGDEGMPSIGPGATSRMIEAWGEALERKDSWDVESLQTGCGVCNDTGAGASDLMMKRSESLPRGIAP